MKMKTNHAEMPLDFMMVDLGRLGSRMDVTARVSRSPEPFTSCHSEGAKRLKNLSKDKLRNLSLAPTRHTSNQR